MKKNLSLQVLFAMSLMIGASSLVAQSSSSASNKKQGAKKSSRKVEQKPTMKSIERELHDIRRDFENNGDKAEAKRRLEPIQSQIDMVVAELKETHAHIWETHKKTLERHLRDTRNFIKNHKFENRK